MLLKTSQPLLLTKWTKQIKQISGMEFFHSKASFWVRKININFYPHSKDNSFFDSGQFLLWNLLQKWFINIEIFAHDYQHSTYAPPPWTTTPSHETNKNHGNYILSEKSSPLKSTIVFLERNDVLRLHVDREDFQWLLRSSALEPGKGSWGWVQATGICFCNDNGSSCWILRLHHSRVQHVAMKGAKFSDARILGKKISMKKLKGFPTRTRLA